MTAVSSRARLRAAWLALVLVTLGVLVFGAIQAAAIVQSSLRPPAEQAPPAVERWPL